MLQLRQSHNMSHAGRIGEPFDPIHSRTRSIGGQYTLPLPPILTATHPAAAHSSVTSTASSQTLLPAGSGPASASSTNSFWLKSEPLTPPVDLKRSGSELSMSNSGYSHMPYAGNGVSLAATSAVSNSVSRPTMQSVRSNSYVNVEQAKASTYGSPQHRTGSAAPQHQRKSSGEAVAPALRVPKTIQTPHINIAELVAEITCLFWFESHSLLQTVHNAQHLSRPVPPLSSDAVPSSGFKKWVSTVLSTTQVAQNVILLALLFIYRLKKLNPTVKGKAGSEYRLLTVALMLGNKFLDDNTYTNKTWAEVSGIMVQEIHIMEVEFLSNMRYSLFTSEADWKEWHAKLGRFGTYVHMVALPLVETSPKPILHAPTLPSPPSSNNASPPFNYVPSPGGLAQVPAAAFNPRPASVNVPSPIGPMPELDPRAYSRKRSHDGEMSEPPAKRASWQPQPHQQPLNPPRNMAPPNTSNAVPRYHLPSLSTFSAPNNSNNNNYNNNAPGHNHPQLLPPPTSRTNTVTYPPPSQWAQTPVTLTSAAPVRPMLQVHNLPTQLDFSRQCSPYHSGSATSSPIGAGSYPSSQSLSFSQSHPLPHSQPQTLSQHQQQQQQSQALPHRRSPSYFLAQRNSPYRPVRGVTTLLVPPPVASVHNAPQHVALEQMQYQPLGRPFNERRHGPVPYLHREAWPDANQFNQWPTLPQQVTQR